jgi:hypothetical protein
MWFVENNNASNGDTLLAEIMVYIGKEKFIPK